MDPSSSMEDRGAADEAPAAAARVASASRSLKKSPKP